MATVSNSDKGKNVVAANGDKVGIVKEVNDGKAYVDPDPSLTDELKSALGWGDRDEDTYPLDENSIETVTDDEIRLSHGR